MKRLMMIVLLVSFVPEVAMAARWTKAEVPVWDFTAEEWRPAVQATVDDFNTQLPSEVPRLRYVPMGEIPCEMLPPNGRRGGISVCTSLSPPGPRYSGWNTKQISHGLITRAMVLIRADAIPVAPTIVLCHEIAHVMWDVPDDYSHPHADTSCVQGFLPHLGPWDIAYATAVYNDDGHHDRDRHRSRHQRHR